MTGPISEEDRVFAHKTLKREAGKPLETGDRMVADGAARGAGRRMRGAEGEATTYIQSGRHAGSSTAKQDGRGSRGETTSQADGGSFRFKQHPEPAIGGGPGRETSGVSPGTQRSGSREMCGQRSETGNASSSGASHGSRGMGRLRVLEEDPGPDGKTSVDRMQKQHQVLLKTFDKTAEGGLVQRQI